MQRPSLRLVSASSSPMTAGDWRRMACETATFRSLESVSQRASTGLDQRQRQTQSSAARPYPHVAFSVSAQPLLFRE